MTVTVKGMLRTLALAALMSAAPLAMAQAPSDQIAAAVAQTSRPAEDRARDEVRHPAELLEFSRVKAGDHVVDFLAGTGYFTRLFSALVGPDGQVFAFSPKEAENQHGIGPDTRAAVEGLANAKAVIEPLLTPGLKDVDVFWTSQNYHDLHTAMAAGADIAAFNKAVFDMLKPGGYYVIIDHAATAGADVASTADTLHRIDPAAVRKEVEAAGFVFDGESSALANASDARDKNVFDESIRGKTDQFAYRFRKPE